MEILKQAFELILKAQEEGLDAGFAIDTSDEGIINFNFREIKGREPNEKELMQINKDIGIIEKNVLQYLKSVLGFARAEGHSNEALIGSCRCTWDNKKGLELIQSHLEEADPNEISGEESEVFYRGVSEIGMSVLGVDLYFFDINEEDKERLENELE